MIKFQTSSLIIVCLVLFGCGDSDPIDTTITPEYIEPIEAYIIGTSSITSIEPPNPFLPTPRTELSASVILQNIRNITVIDKDLSTDREENERFLEDRSINAEFFAYLDNEEPEKLFLYDAKSRRNQTLFDLTDPINKSGDRLFCELRPSDLADIERLKQDRYEVKQELKVFGSTASENCTNPEELNYYLFTITPDADAQYSVRQPVKLENEDPSIIEYEIQKVSYPLYTANRRSISSSLFRSRELITDSQTNSYGFLSYELKVDPINGNEANWSLHLPIDLDNTETYEYWQESFTNPNNNLVSSHVLNPHIQSDDPYFIALGNQLLKISERETFELILESNRRQQLSSPIYEWIESAGPTGDNISILNTNSVALIDGNKLKFVDTNGTTSQIRVLSDAENTLVPSPENIILKEKNGTIAALSLIEQSGTKRLLIGQANAIQTYPLKNYFDYHMVDANAFVDHRYAQTHDNGTIKFNPAIENSAWLWVKNYLEDELQQLILHSDDTSGGLMRSPAIYTYDALENNGQGSYKGIIDADFAVIEEAAIIGERFGMIWVRESFESDAQIKAYYFNPSDSEWAFTLVSEDTIMPAWLPYMKP